MTRWLNQCHFSNNLFCMFPILFVLFLLATLTSPAPLGRQRSIIFTFANATDIKEGATENATKLNSIHLTSSIAVTTDGNKTDDNFEVTTSDQVSYPNIVWFDQSRSEDEPIEI